MTIKQFKRKRIVLTDEEKAEKKKRLVERRPLKINVRTVHELETNEN